MQVQSIHSSMQSIAAHAAGEKGEAIVAGALKALGVDYVQRQKLRDLDFHAIPDFIFRSQATGRKVIVEVRTQQTTGTAREKNAFTVAKLDLIRQQKDCDVYLVYSGQYLEDWMAECPVMKATYAQFPEVQVISAEQFAALLPSIA